MTHRDDDAAMLRRRSQLAHEIASLDTASRERAEEEIAAIDAARVRLPQVAHAKIASVTLGRPFPLGNTPFDPRRVERMFETRRPALRACYARALARHRDLGGRITISMTIVPDGRVRDVFVTEDFPRSAEIASCLARVASRLRFNSGPPVPARFEMPLTFSP